MWFKSFLLRCLTNIYHLVYYTVIKNSYDLWKCFKNRYLIYMDLSHLKITSFFHSINISEHPLGVRNLIIRIQANFKRWNSEMQHRYIHFEKISSVHIKDAIEDNSQHRRRHRQHRYQWRSISFLPQCHHPPSLLLEYCSWLPKPWAWITNPLLSQEPGQIQLLSSPPTRKAACLNPSKPFLNDTHLYPTFTISSTAKNRMDPSQTGFMQLELLTTHACGLYLQNTLSVDTV